MLHLQAVVKPPPDEVATNGANLTVSFVHHCAYLMLTIYLGSLPCVQATGNRVIPLMTALNGYPEYDPNQNSSGDEEDEEGDEGAEGETEGEQEGREEEERVEEGEEEVAAEPEAENNTEATVVTIE